MPDWFPKEKLKKFYSSYQSEMDMIIFFSIILFIVIPLIFNYFYEGNISISQKILNTKEINDSVNWWYWGYAIIKITFIYKVAETFFKKLFYRKKVRNNSNKKNYYTQGNAKWADKDDLMQNYVLVEYDNSSTDGIIIKRFARFSFKILFFPRCKWKDVNFFEGKYTKQIEAYIEKKLAEGYSLQKAGEKANEKFPDMEFKKMEKKINSNIFYKLFKVEYKDMCWIDTDPKHSTTITTSRGGKGVFFVIPNMHRWINLKTYENKPTIVTTDLKKENAEATVQNAIDNGYEVVILNLMNPSNSHSYNPLDKIINIYKSEIKIVQEKIEFIKRLEEKYKDYSEEEKTHLIEEEFSKEQTKNLEKIEELINELSSKNSVDEITEEVIFLKTKRKTILDSIKMQKESIRRIKLSSIDEEEVKKVIERINGVTKEIDFLILEKNKINEQLLYEGIDEEIEKNLDQELAEVENKIKKIKQAELDDMAKLYILQKNFLSSLSLGQVQLEITKISSSILTVGEVKDETWINSARSLLSSFIFFVLESCFLRRDLEYKKCNLYNISVQYKNLFVEIKENKESINVYQKILKSYNDIKHFSLQTFPSGSGNTLQSTKLTLDLKMNLFSNDVIGKFMSSTSFDMQKIVDGEKPTIIYLVTPFDDTTFNFIASLFIDQLFSLSVLTALLNKNSKLKRQIRVMGDEFGNVPEIKDFVIKQTISLGIKFSFHLVLQDKAQLENIYGNIGSKTILANCHQKYMLKAGDMDTCKWISEECGNTTIVKKSVTTSAKIEHSTTMEDEVGVPLIEPTEVNVLPFGQGVVASVGIRPVMANYRPSFQYALNQHLKIADLVKSGAINNNHINTHIDDMVF